MRRATILSLFLLLAARTGGAQWIEDRTGESDRPHSRHEKRTRTLALPPPEDPMWPFPNIDVIHSDPFFLVDQTEPSIAINPTDSLNIIIGANDDRSDTTLFAYSTTDGGLTWSNISLPPNKQFTIYATDPSMMFDRNGNAIFGNGHYRDNNAYTDVACYRSTNKGATWNFAGTPYLNTDFGNDTNTDKYYFTVDASPSSPFKDRIYAVWVEYAGSPGATIDFSFSDDDGQHWSKRIFLSDLGYYTAPVPATAPDGTLIVAYVNYRFGQESILSLHSTDGGVTFSAPQTISSYTNLGAIQPSNDQNGYPIIKNDLMVNSFPSIAIDESGKHPGRAYVTWCGLDATNRARVFLSTSDDGGKQWSTPRPVDCDSSSFASDKFFPWVAVDPTTGDVGVDYNDSRLDPNNVLSNLFMSFSTDGGDSFTARRISSVSSDPTKGQDSRGSFQFFGDYIGIAGRSGNWYPAWTDQRNITDLDIYTAIVQPYAPMPVTNLVARDTTIGGVTEVILTWTYNPETTFGYPLPPDYHFSITEDSVHVFRLIGSGRSYALFNTGTLVSHKIGVTVVAGKLASRTAFVNSGTSGVAATIQSPKFNLETVEGVVIAGRECDLRVTGDAVSNISLTFYDELGRTIGNQLTDGRVSIQHDLSITFPTPGVRFYVLREEFPSGGAREFTGKLLVQAR